jgi:hypothetical protein
MAGLDWSFVLCGAREPDTVSHRDHATISTAPYCHLDHHRPWLLVAGCSPLLLAASRLASSSPPGHGCLTFAPSRAMIQVSRGGLLGFSFLASIPRRLTFPRRDIAAATGGGQPDAWSCAWPPLELHAVDPHQ